jgi:hypothetical protein
MASGGAVDHTVRFYDMDPTGSGSGGAGGGAGGQRLICATPSDGGAIRAVRFLPQASVAEGMAALAGGALDVLARNATLTFSRDAGQPVPPERSALVVARPRDGRGAGPLGARL